MTGATPWTKLTGGHDMFDPRPSVDEQYLTQNHTAIRFSIKTSVRRKTPIHTRKNEWNQK